MTARPAQMTPDLYLIHGDLIARGIPCHLTSDGAGYPTAVTATHPTGAAIECRWVDGAYAVTFPCGMVTATMRTVAPAASVAAEVAWQYDCYTRLAQDAEHETAGGYWTTTADGRRWVSDDETACRADSHYQD